MINTLIAASVNFAICIEGNESVISLFLIIVAIRMQRSLGKIIFHGTTAWWLVSQQIISVSNKLMCNLFWARYSFYFLPLTFSDLFVGQLKSMLKCCNCGYTSVTFDPFWDLSLPIPRVSRLLWNYETIFQILWSGSWRFFSQKKGSRENDNLRSAVPFFAAEEKVFLFVSFLPPRKEKNSWPQVTSGKNYPVFCLFCFVFSPCEKSRFTSQTELQVENFCVYLRLNLAKSCALLR